MNGTGSWGNKPGESGEKREGLGSGPTDDPVEDSHQGRVRSKEALSSGKRSWRKWVGEAALVLTAPIYGTFQSRELCILDLILTTDVSASSTLETKMQKPGEVFDLSKVIALGL